MRRRAGPVFRLARFLARTLITLLFCVRVDGLEPLPAGGYVLAANHLNWLDPFLILCFLPAEPRIHFVAARELTTGVWWRRWLLHLIGGVIPIDRSAVSLRHLTEEVQRILRAGGVLGIFPEGKEGSAEGRLQPLKKGVAYFAATNGVPVIPIGISGTAELFLSKRIRLAIGPPVYPAPGLEPERFLDTIAAALMAAIPPLDPHQPAEKRWQFLTDLLH